jgi:hypothetical protein
VKLGKNASDTCAMLSKAYRGEAVRKSSVSEWHKWFKEDLKNECDKTVLITSFNIMGIVHFEFIPQGHTVNQAYYM